MSEAVADLYQRFLKSKDESEGQNCRTRLLEDHALPLIRTIVQRKMKPHFRPGMTPSTPDEERAHEAYIHVLWALGRQLDRWRAQSATPPDEFMDYVAKMAYNTCHKAWKQSAPGMAAAEKTVSYLLTHQVGLSLWQDHQYILYGGYLAWTKERSPADERTLKALENDPAAFVAAGLKRRGNRTNLKHCKPADLLIAIFDQAGAPVPLDALSPAFAQVYEKPQKAIQTVSTTQATQQTEEERDLYDTLDAGIDLEKDALDQAATDALLKDLWGKIAQLPVHQRLALLLNLPELDLDILRARRIASFDEIALKLDPAETGDLKSSLRRLASFWNRLPLDDNEIATMLNVTVEQVKNLRQSARRSLDWKIAPFHRGHLRRLWLCVIQLIAPRPAIFMLYHHDARGMSLLRRLPRESIANPEEIAQKLPLSVECLKKHWGNLPLPFVAIAKLLSRTPREVSLLYDEALSQIRKCLLREGLKTDDYKALKALLERSDA